MKVEVQSRIVNLPDFLGVGAAKSGTTSLHYYLKQHPEIFMPRDIKETCFFSFADNPAEKEIGVTRLRAVWKFEEYTKLFDAASEKQTVGEISVPYLYFYERTIRNIKRYIPDWQKLKIFMILRNPVDRAFSHYSMHRLWGGMPLEFGDAIKQAIENFPEGLETDGWPSFDYVGFGRYYKQVKAYIDNFTNVRVYLFDDLKRDSFGIMKDLFGFLGVDESFVPDTSTEYNVSKREPLSWSLYRFLSKPSAISSILPIAKLIPLRKRVAFIEDLKRKLLVRDKQIELDEETRDYLKSLYKDDIMKLQDLIKRDLSAWLK